MSIFVPESLDEIKKEYGFLAVDILIRFEDEVKEKILSSELSNRINTYLSGMDYDDYASIQWDYVSDYINLIEDQIIILGNLETIQEFKEKYLEFVNNLNAKIDPRLLDSFAYHRLSIIQSKYYDELNDLNTAYNHTSVKTISPRIIYNLYSDSYFYESSKCW